MKRAPVITMGLLVVGLTVLGWAYLSFGQSAAGWTTLIDGATGRDNWNRVGDANWRAEDGAIVADKGKGGFLVSKSSFKDFQIRAEFWADHTTTAASSSAAPIQQDHRHQRLRGEHLRPAPDPSYGTGGSSTWPRSRPCQGRRQMEHLRDHGQGLAAHRRAERSPDRRRSGQPARAGTVRLQFGNGPNDAPGGVIKWRKVQIKPL